MGIYDSESSGFNDLRNHVCMLSQVRVSSGNIYPQHVFSLCIMTEAARIHHVKLTECLSCRRLHKTGTTAAHVNTSELAPPTGGATADEAEEANSPSRGKRRPAPAAEETGARFPLLSNNPLGRFGIRGRGLTMRKQRIREVE